MDGSMFGTPACRLASNGTTLINNCATGPAERLPI